SLRFSGSPGSRAMLDDATLQRYAEALHAKRCAVGAEAGFRPTFVVEPWGERPEFLKQLDREMAAVVAGMAAADERARICKLAVATDATWYGDATDYPFADLIRERP